MAEAIQGPWQHVVITTFGLDLGFFERAVLPQVAQARGRLLLADTDHLLAHQAAAARGRLVRHLNHSYLACGVSVGGAAHAKVVLLLSESRGRLLVGSGNLRLTGWGAAGEMFTRYDFSDEDRSMLPAFVGARELLDGLCEQHLVDDSGAGYLGHLWSRVPWLVDRAQGETRPVLHNLTMPLLDQFVEGVHVRGVPKDLVMFAPFHDPDCAAVSSLLERTDPRAATLLIQPGRTSIDPGALSGLMERFPQLNVRPFGPRGNHDQYVHAKFILARFVGESLCLQGSANLSRSALLKTVPAGNVEIVNLLSGEAETFDPLLSEMWVGKPVTDAASLDVRFQPGPDVEPSLQLRLLEARWDGEFLILRVAGLQEAASEYLWLRMGSSLVRAQVAYAEADPSRAGQLRLRLRISDAAEDLFSKATPLAVYTGDGPPPAKVDDADLSEPIFCVNQPALIERLEARPASVRIQTVGLLSLENDRELEELLTALQGTMIYDKRTLVEARPPTSLAEGEPDDEQLRIAYADIDYEVLRSSARIQQYADALGSVAKATLGPIPSDIQLALRSITDAFDEIVGRSPGGAKTVAFANDWTAVEDEAADVEDLALIQKDPEESGAEETDEGSADLEQLEEAAERRWSEAARLRLHWRNFIGRYLRGLESPAWQELVGTAVLSGNYEVFSHVLQRLHRQQWQNFEFMEFLVRAQAAAHGFVWGRFEGGQEGGWLSSLSPRERDIVVKAFSERHLAVRLLVDLAGCGALTRPGESDDSGRPLKERKWIRDVARAVLVHPAWPKLVGGEGDLPLATAAVAADLTVGEDFCYWQEAPSFGQLLLDIEELVAFSTMAEFQNDIANLVGTTPLAVHLREVMLAPEGRQTATQDLEIQGLDTPLDLDTALETMARFARFHPGPRYRVHAGRVRLLYDRERSELTWVPNLDDIVILEVLPPVESPWDQGLSALRALSPIEETEAVA